jgi:hypothetical protein
MQVSDQLHDLAALPPGKRASGTHPLDRRVGGPQSQSNLKISHGRTFPLLTGRCVHADHKQFPSGCPSCPTSPTSPTSPNSLYSVFQWPVLKRKSSAGNPQSSFVFGTLGKYTRVCLYSSSLVKIKLIMKTYLLLS